MHSFYMGPISWLPVICQVLGYRAAAPVFRELQTGEGANHQFEEQRGGQCTGVQSYTKGWLGARLAR